METRQVLFTWIFVLSAVQIKAVSVNPYLCPTNKIAPHRRISNTRASSRTLGAYVDLLTPNFNQQYAPPSALQEEPQKDDPEDCGDIDDYDENDLSSLTSPLQQRQGYNDSRFLFGIFRPPFVNPNPAPPAPAPVKPARPPHYPPLRPPYWSGGQFENNPYRPPVHHIPSDSIKPVYEPGVNEPPVHYRPQLVGGPSYAIVGASPVPFRPPRPRPYQDPTEAQTQRAPRPRPGYDPDRDRTPPPQSSPGYTTTRRPRARRLNNNNDGIIGSFLDLLF